MQFNLLFFILWQILLINIKHANSYTYRCLMQVNKIDKIYPPNSHPQLGRHLIWRYDQHGTQSDSF